ncbi:MAG: hypothetical protein M3010_05085 [Candidatus Dormibacteraeota bacterium]|nr:hypothetical protein [Candidatus Dormibacteraeota bacterium]
MVSPGGTAPADIGTPWPVDLSPDALWTWDGKAWKATQLSPDGQYFWYRNAWHPLPAPSAPAVSTISARPVHQLVGVPLTWRVETHQALLRAGDDIIAALQGEFTSLSMNQKFKGLAADRAWTFEHSGFGQTHIRVTSEATGAVVTEFGSRGDLETHVDLPSGQRVGFKLRNFFTKTWMWVDSTGQPLVNLDREAMASWGSTVEERKVLIEPAAASVPELSLLLLLGEYLAREIDRRS